MLAKSVIYEKVEHISSLQVYFFNPFHLLHYVYAKPSRFMGCYIEESF